MLFTFPSRYSFAIGLSGVFSLAGWARLIHAGLHVSRATQGTDRVRHASRKGLSPSMAGLSRPFRSLVSVPCLRPTTPRRPDPPGFGLCRVRSPLLAVSLLFSLPPGTKMFQFPGFAPAQLVPGLQPGGLPHSGIRGSFRICRSPRLFAAYHALRRLREPQASAVRPFLVSLDLPVSIIRRRRSLCVALLCFLLLLFCPICQ